MLVEDEFIVSMLTEDMLIELGHEVIHIAATLEQGMAYAQQAGFELAVLDVNLNGVMSYPIADQLVEKAIPFVFASGYAAVGIDDRYPGISKLQKPFTLAGLESVLTSATASRKA